MNFGNRCQNLNALGMFHFFTDTIKDMRRFFLLLSLSVFFAMNIASASAHVLLPKALVEYVKDHPTATAEEIQQFVDAHPDVKAADPAGGQTLVELARSQGTPNFFQNAFAFFILGIEHILSGPDHILFVFSILLTFVTLRKTAWL